jgi:hypothetical protein
MCRKRLGPREKAPFSKELQYIPPKRRTGGDGQRWMENRNSSSWRLGGGEPWNQKGSSRSGGSGGRDRSDAPSWRRETGKLIEGKNGKGEEEEGEEATGPPKKTVQGASGEEPRAKKKLLPTLTGGHKSEGVGVLASERLGT